MIKAHLSSSLRIGCREVFFKTGIKTIAVRCCSSVAAEDANDAATTAAKSFKDMPGPSQWPILGNLNHFRNGPDKLHVTHHQQAKKFGKLFKDRIFNVAHVVISDPLIAEQVYKSEAKLPLRELDLVLGIYIEERAKLDLPKGINET